MQYLRQIEVNRIPAILTTLYPGFVPFGVLQGDIQKLHPGARFKIARKLLRRLCPALAFLHFHGIVHGSVGDESVLLRRTVRQPEEVLLVNYSNARPFISGAQPAKADLVQDARAAMTLVESCCSIWTLRKTACRGAIGEKVMESRTQNAMREYHTVKRVASDYFGRQGNSRESDEGKKMTKLLFEKHNEWQRARSAQEYNVKLRGVGMLSKVKIDSFVTEWLTSNAKSEFGEHQWMILSLGQKWLDDLANKIYQSDGKRWDLTPAEICSKVYDLCGLIEEPWQSFVVRTTVSIEQSIQGYDEESFIAWVATCHDAHPKSREALQQATEQHLQSLEQVINSQMLSDFEAALLANGKLPASIASTLRRLIELANTESKFDGTVLRQLEATHRVLYHVPSRMFNMTQLQRLTSPELLVSAINNDAIHCDSFVKVRGEPSIQGHYAPLALLQYMADELRLVLLAPPKVTAGLPTYDAADFSQVKPGLIVLAHTGLLGFATVIRSGEQCNFLEPKLATDFETGHHFLPTYFGDMKVLANNICRHERASHWSKFKTVTESEQGASLNKRQILPMKKLSQMSKAKLGVGSSHKQSSPERIQVEESALSKVLKANEMLLASARMPTKRDNETDGTSSGISNAALKHSRTDLEQSKTIFSKLHAHQPSQRTSPPRPVQQQEQLLGLSRIANTSFENTSFQKRNAGLFIAPPDEDVLNQSFTVTDDVEGLEDDQAQVDTMIANMQDSDDEGEVQGLTGFIFHGNLTNSPSPPRRQTSFENAKGNPMKVGSLEPRD